MIKRGEEMCNETLNVRAGGIGKWRRLIIELDHVCVEIVHREYKLDKVTLESRLYIPVTTHLRDPPI